MNKYQKVLDQFEERFCASKMADPYDSKSEIIILNDRLSNDFTVEDIKAFLVKALEEVYHQGEHDGLERGLAFKPEVLKQVRKEVIQEILASFERVEKSLRAEYPNDHFSPNYRGIVEDLFEQTGEEK